MKQTAVEWLAEKLESITQDLFQQAKEMEKQQIIDAYNENENYMCDGTEGEQYYNETFKK